MIQMIKTSNISPHYQNPRKDLGDLSELSESIKAQGILQNLTIVPKNPGYCTSCNLWNGGIGKCREDHDKNERPPCSRYVSDGSYVVIIGHRRLAAAKLAGLIEVPCVISNMDQKTQLATMLLENMQRSDLTVYEQAQGFQMMMDLGETINDISGKTGLSESTVRRRVKLLELDQDKFKASVERGASLLDYAELEKIENTEIRNSVLEKIGTSNFKWALKEAIDKEKRDKILEVLINGLDSFATRTQSTVGLKWIKSYHGNPSDKVDKPEDAGRVKYFYSVSPYGQIVLYCEPDKRIVEETKEDVEKREKKIRNEKMLDEITRRAYWIRRSFAKSISNAKAKKNIELIIENAIYSADIYIDYGDLAEFFDLEKTDDEDWEFADLIEYVKKQPEMYLLGMVYCQMDSPRQNYHNWQNKHEKNEILDKLYSMLEGLGYELSDEELALKNGTHELFEGENTR